MERCPVCGSPVRAGANFCTACGHRLTAGERAAAAAAPAVAAPTGAAADVAPGDAPAEPTATAQDAPVAVSDPTEVPWAMPMPAEERRATGDRWGQNGPKASADLWPTPERADDPWTRPKSDAKALGGEPSGEGYAAWDAAPSSWIGWNTPSDERVEEVVAHEVPDPPVAEVDPTDDEDETAPFAWPDEPGAEPVTEPVVEMESAAHVSEADAGAEAEDLPATAPAAAARDGWDAYIASRETARAKAAEGDVVARGMSLVEQLRDLLPAIVLSEPATMRRVANDLAAARDEAQTVPHEDLDRLRGVLEASRDNPRDIDALVQLGKHAEELIELMGSYERYSGAIDRAVGELTQGPGVAAIGGSDPVDELPAETDAGNGQS